MEDVDLANQEALIAWQVQRIKRQPLRRETKTKTSDAPLPLPEICVKALEQRRVTEARWRLAAGEAWGSSGLVLTTRYGDALDPRNFYRYFKARAEKAGVPVISVHATRKDVRFAPGRPRRTSTSSNGDPAPQQNRADDGGLRAGLFVRHPRCTQTPWKPARMSLPTNQRGLGPMGTAKCLAVGIPGGGSRRATVCVHGVVTTRRW